MSRDTSNADRFEKAPQDAIGDLLDWAAPAPSGPEVAWDWPTDAGPPAPAAAAGTGSPGCRGRFHILRPHAAGGLGQVSVARDEELEREVALKEIRPELAHRDANRERFVAEARITGQLEHPNIVPVYGLGLDEHARPYYAMRLVNGRTLAQTIADYHAAPAPTRSGLLDLLRRFTEICGAVAYAHSRGVVHRDLKPHNVMLGDYGETLVLDWGIAKRFGGGGGDPLAGGSNPADGRRPAAVSDTTRAGDVLGTTAYMSPEQAADPQRAGPAADIYSLGAILYQILTGRPPGGGGDRPGPAATEADDPAATSALSDAATAPDPTPEGPPAAGRSKRRPETAGRPAVRVAKPLEAVCRKAMSADVTHRYGSALDLAQEINRWLADEPVSAYREPLTSRVGRWARHHRPAVAGLFVLLVTAVVGLTAGTILIGRERRNAVAARILAEGAHWNSEQGRRATLLAQGRAQRRAADTGRRFGALDALAAAAQIRPGLHPGTTLELRNEAIACLAQPDLRREQRWDLGQPPFLAQLVVDDTATRYARSDRQGTVTVHDSRNDRRLLTLPGPGVSVGPVFRFSPDGRFLAVTNWPEHDAEFRLWDLHSGGGRLALRLTGVAGDGADFTRDGKAVLVARREAAGSTVTRYALPSAEPVRTLRLDDDDDGPGRVTGVRLQPTGEKIAVLLDDGMELRVLDFALGTLDHRIRFPSRVGSIAWHPAGRLLAVAEGNHHVLLLDTVTRATRVTLRGVESPAYRLAFSAGGDLLAVGSGDRMVRLWDPYTGRLLLSCAGFAQSVRFCAGDTRLVVCGLTTADVWEVACGRERVALDGHWGADGPWAADFSPDGRLVATGGLDGLRLWHAASGRQLGELRIESGGASSVLFEPSGGGLVVSTPADVLRLAVKGNPTAPGTVGLGPPERFVGPTTEAHHHWGPAAMSADGRLLVHVGEGRYALIDPRNPAAPERVIGPVPPLCHVALSPDGRWAAVGSLHESAVRVWDLRSGKQVYTTAVAPNTDSQQQAAFSPDGRWLVTGGTDAYVLWEVGSWKWCHRFPRAPDGGTARAPIAFSPDSRVLAVAHSNVLVRLYSLDADTRPQLATLEDPDPRVLSWLRFSPDGGRLAAVTENHQVYLWDLALIRKQLGGMGLDWAPPAAALPAAARPQPRAGQHPETAVAGGLGSEPAVGKPFGATPAAVPGVIQAENFDEGNEDDRPAPYFDVSPERWGRSFRTATVDMFPCEEDGGGYAIVSAQVGEWLAYTVDVAEAGAYVADLRVAAPGGGGRLHLEFAGEDTTGAVTLPDTGDWQRWKTVTTRPFRLRAGPQRMRVMFDGRATGGDAAKKQQVGNLNWIALRPADAGPPPKPGG